ncbi:MAG: hypothetical protein ABUS51_03670 [Acidobacteriota bacterium]
MKPAFGTFIRRMPGVIAAGLMVNSFAIPGAFANDAMPVARQNALIQKYCAVCHTDAVRNGGLSLEHFDAAQTAPSLAAMMVSKLTSGVLLETVKAAASDPGAATLVDRKMKSGAMGAAGLPIPDKATIDALIDALASEAARADEWYVKRTQDPVTKAPLLTASILREWPSTGNSGEAAMYRLVLTCNAATRQGEMQLAWAPLPKTGVLSVTVDGNTAVTYQVEGREKMGNGSQAITGPAAISLYNSAMNAPGRGMPLPEHSLGIKSFLANESVEFPFSDLTLTARQSLGACFKEN